MRNGSMRTWLSVSAAALLLLALAGGCGSSGGDGGDGDGGNGGDTSGGGDVVTPGDTAGGGDATAGADADAGAPRDDLVAELFGLESEITEQTEANQTVRVRVFDPVSAQPASGVIVNFSLEVVTPPETGSADATIDETVVLTDSQGVADTKFWSGTAPGAVYRLTATAEGAPDPVTLTVTVESAPTGQIHVSYTYEGDDAAPVNVRVLLAMAVYECDAFNPGAPPDVPFEETVAFADGEWTSPDVQQSPNWNVMLVGLDAAGSVVAGGCAQEVRVVADQTSNVDVVMTPVGLHLPGLYDLAETLDVSAARPADAETLVTTLQTLFADPRQALATALDAAVTEQLAPTDTDSECTDLWQADVPTAVDGAVAEQAAWIVPFEGLPAALDAALAAVTVGGEVTITGSAPGPFDGAIDWQSVGLTFDGDAIVWEPGDWAAAVYPIRLSDETTTFTARVDGYDDLVVEEHSLVLEPGRLAAALVTERILADAPAGPAALADVAVAFFDCPSVVAALSADVTTCLSDNQISTESVVQTCEQVVRDHVQPATDILEGWVVPSVSLDLTGAGTVVDADQDLGVDRVDDGTLDGELTYDDAPAGAVTGTFTMTR